MTLSAGTRLGPYEITAKRGAGGMGEVYRATDTKLGREGAIKVLLRSPLETSLPGENSFAYDGGLLSASGGRSKA